MDILPFIYSLTYIIIIIIIKNHEPSDRLAHIGQRREESTVEMILS